MDLLIVFVFFILFTINGAKVAPICHRSSIFLFEYVAEKKNFKSQYFIKIFIGLAEASSVNLVSIIASIKYK